MYWNGLICSEKDLENYSYISTCEELQAIGLHSSGDYILTNNIDCSKTATPGASVWGAEGFIPIGDTGSFFNRFTGTINGDGYEVSNLYMKRRDTGVNSLGLVHSLSGSIINLGLTNVSITNSRTQSNTGAFAGVINNGGSVKNSYVTGKITSAASVGGITGALIQGTISKSYSSASIKQVGYIGSWEISNYFPYAGGLVGYSVNANVSNSYFDGSISSSNSAIIKGGLVASFLNGGTILDSYSTFTNLVGGTTGQGYTQVGTITDSYFPPSSNLKSAGTFVKWSTSTWRIIDGSYPTLISETI